MSAATVYTKATGEMLWSVEGDAGVIASQETAANSILVGTWDADAWWVQAGVATPRPTLHINATERITVGDPLFVNNAPAGTEVWLEGEKVGVIDASTPLEFDMPDTYALELRPPFPWRPAECVVTATP